ncbi:hypothetical protein CYMTET_2861 [Cymbomonas tetramitiformis]|uniref:Uncharacterized protein n=1 Tax=Cymbomonas tetramitiformis TaxID=36881 RepID=A0AAE0H4F8_9CHLO|nr:hypothetical protein CYMTET_2861 [Cymbomonas tetramitiformis]
MTQPVARQPVYAGPLPIPNMRVGGPTPAGDLSSTFASTPFASGMTSGPAMNPASPFPGGGGPSGYNRGNQPGMLWAQETVPQMYLHKVFSGERNASMFTEEYREMVADLWKDVYYNVRGVTNSATPQLPLFMLVSDKIVSTFDISDITNKDILKFRGMTGQFVTWGALAKYLRKTDETKRLKDRMQETEAQIHRNTADPAEYARMLLNSARVLQINFVGILKNIPTGGVGSSSVSMNVISGGRVTMINHWGTSCMEGTSLFFVLAEGHPEGRSYSVNKRELKFFPYANALTNERPAVGFPLGVEVAHGVLPREQHTVLRVIPVGRCLHATMDTRRQNRAHRVNKNSFGRTYVDFCDIAREGLASDVRSLGTIEIYVGA